MVTLQPYTEASLAEIATCLKRGEVAILPTDTVYGLVCHPHFPDALERIRQMKCRDRNKPFQMLMASVEHVWADGACKTALSESAAAFWPGGLTLVMDTYDGRTEGYRVPDSALLRKLLTYCGGALRATSVNISGESPAVSLADIPQTILESVDCILDGGTIPNASPSTVIQITPKQTLHVLRPGSLSAYILATHAQN